MDVAISWSSVPSMGGASMTLDVEGTAVWGPSLVVGATGATPRA